MAEKDFIQSNGIPLRIAACNCLLGMTRDMEDFVEADEQFTNWDGIVGASLRDPTHIVVGVKYVDSRDGTANDGFNDDAKALCTILQPYTNYPASIPVGSSPDNLIVMARGKIKWKSGKPVFPAITIKLRPYKCVLDYTYLGNTNASGEGEVGYEGKDKTPPTGGTEDIMDLWMFEGEVPPNYFYDYEGHYAAIQRNQEKAQYEFNERFGMITLQETHYFENKDRPSDEKTKWEALPDYVPNPTLYPRAETGEAYDFKRNESWDCRYRFPNWWFEQNKNVIVWCEGSPVRLPAISYDGYEQFPEVEATEWQYTPVKTQNVSIHDNPFFDPKSASNLEGVAPVIKGFYVDGELPSATGWKALAQSTSLKWYKYIRKRYSYSFNVESPSAPYYYVPDNTVGAQGVYYNDYQSYPYNYIWRGQLAYVVKPISYDYYSSDQKFKCDTWWRMEVSAPLAEWNWDDDEEVGTTISGWILLKKKVCDTSKGGYYGDAWVGGGVSVGWNNGGYGGNFFYTWWSSPVTGGRKFIWSKELGDFPAGEIPWSVTINRKNAKEKDDGLKSFVPFFDFPIGGEIWVSDGHGGLTSIRCGDPIENGMSYISDFIVTAISTP